ncbi:MAG: PIN domain-containing protein [Bacteroidota bacterium]|nr:PIN domain-containing protein [Bacteroidota bacterium]
MRIIVDANIVFSGILRSDGKIGDLLINSGSIFKFISPDFLRKEIQRHHEKLIQISKLTSEQVIESEFQIYKSIHFISDEQISLSNWDIAENLVYDVDKKDVSYIAFSKQFKAKVWSGDKALIKGLANKGFTNFISTNELWELRQKKLK